MKKNHNKRRRQKGRPAGNLAGLREHSAALSAYGRYRYGAVRV